MPITLDRRPKGTYPSGIFHTSLRSTLCIESELERDVTLGNVPSSELAILLYTYIYTEDVKRQLILGYITNQSALATKQTD